MISNDFLISGFINTGRLTGQNIRFDGVTYGTTPGFDPAEPDPPMEYLPSGWTARSTKIGGVRSKGVDDLSMWLYNNDYKDVAGRIPAFHVFADIPEGASQVTSLGEMSKKIAALDPTKAKDEKDRQKQENVRAVMNVMFGLAPALGVAALDADYRGGPVGDIPRAMIGNVQNAAIRAPWTASPGSPPEQAFFLDHMYKPPAQLHYARWFPNPDKPSEGDTPDNVAAFRDHFVYSLMFVTTDEKAAVRYWNSWVAHLGILVPNNLR